VGNILRQLNCIVCRRLYRVVWFARVFIGKIKKILKEKWDNGRD